MEKLEKLKELMKLLNESISREEFTSAFKKVLEVVVQMEKRNKEALETMQRVYSSLITKTDTEKKSAIKELKEEGKIALNQILKTSQEKLWQLDLSFLTSKDKIVEEALGKVPPQLPFPEIKPITPEEIIQKISGVLEVKDIKDLQEAIDKVKKRGITYLGPGSESGGHIVKLYDLSSQLNGVLKTFALPAFWRIVGVQLTSLPYGAARLTTDYTVDGSAFTITFTDAIDASTVLASGQSLLVQYASA